MKNPAAQAVRIAWFTLLGTGVFAAFPLDATAGSREVAPAPMELMQPAAATPWLRYGGWTATDWKDYNTLVKTATPA